MTILLSLLLATQQPSLQESLDLAMAAIEQCSAEGQAVAASVVDAQGVPIVVLRANDLTKPPSAASRKAATAVAFASTGEAMEQRQKSDAPFAATIAAHRDIYNPDGGSIPLYRGKDMVGGLAVAYTGHDIAHLCAVAAVKAHPLIAVPR